MKTTSKTLKAPLLLAATFSALSINALAETYTVQVELNSTIGETPLVATETQPMTYPVLEVNQATKEGASCIARVGYDNTNGFDNLPASNVNSLCAGSTPLRAEVQFTGVPNAVISYERNLIIQEQYGVRFAHWDGKDFQRVDISTLSPEQGKLSTSLSSAIILFDKSQVTDAVMEFTYDISAAYQ